MARPELPALLFPYPASFIQVDIAPVCCSCEEVFFLSVYYFVVTSQPESYMLFVECPTEVSSALAEPVSLIVSS